MRTTIVTISLDLDEWGHILKCLAHGGESGVTTAAVHHQHLINHIKRDISKAIRQVDGRTGELKESEK